FRTSRKIVVFESDDWGSIRMPNKLVYDQLRQKIKGVDKLPYQRYDTLANKEDLYALFACLRSFKDHQGNYPVITANTIMANPDFDMIKQDNYENYHYESFTKTIERYYGNEVFPLWKQGIQEGIFFPQFHGREHLNVKRWLFALQENIGHVRLAFEHGFFDLSTSLTIGENSFMDALDIATPEDLEEIKLILADGLKLFENIFGFKAKTFIAPCYVWSGELESTLKQYGVIGIQGNWFQKVPLPGTPGLYKNKFHYTGQKNKHGQFYLVRNASFEPSDNPEFDWISDVLKRAEVAFRMGKPLIISTHRLNYIGAIVPENSKRNLDLLAKLLSQLLERHPEIEFLNSAQLAELIVAKKK
ncbi:MAG: hypothetical protein ACOVJ8_01645, partial [Sediminibacterium sp.]